MKISIILPFVQPGGGVRIVFEHCRGLQQLGHEVVIYYPGGQGAVKRKMGQAERLSRKVKYLIQRQFLNQKEEAWFDQPLPVMRIPDLDSRHIRTADIVIATSNETADWVATYPERCGEKVYFIQDYETWSREAELVDKTWRYPMAKVTISQWLVELGQQKFQQKMYGPVENGLTHSLFFPDPSLADSQKLYDVLMIYRAASQKGCARGLTILQKLKERHPKLSFCFFGRDQAPSELTALGEYIFDPPQAEIRHIYSKARTFFLPSFQEGFAGPPLEAMACGCCVVATRVGGPMDYIQEGENGLLADPNQEEELATQLEKAVTNATLREQLAKRGLEKAQEYTWEKATQKLAEILESIITEYGRHS